MSEPLPVSTVLVRALPILIGALVAVAASFLFPLPRPLDGFEASASLWLSHSGKYGLPLLILGMVALFVTRPGAERSRRLREAAALCGTLVVAIGLVAWANEFVLKRQLQIPRPNIVRLADAGELGGKTPAEFYALGDKQARRAFLKEHLPAAPLGGPKLPPGIRHHWIEEVGYTFPSGHATAAMTFCAFFLALGLALLEGVRCRLVLLVVPWGVAVCWSRVVLGVHRPLDVSVGALQGVVLGLIAFPVALRLGWGAPPAAEEPAATA